MTRVKDQPESDSIGHGGFPHCPEIELLRIGMYLTTVRDRLRLNQWDITLMAKPAPKDCHAAVQPQTNHHIAQMRLSREWMEMSEEQKKNTLIHEMIHLGHYDMDLVWQGCVNENSGISKDDAHAWDTDFHMYLERFVSDVTRWLEDTLPDFPTGKPLRSKVGEGIRMEML